MIFLNPQLSLSIKGDTTNDYLKSIQFHFASRINTTIYFRVIIQCVMRFEVPKNQTALPTYEAILEKYLVFACKE